ncbi:MAG: DinB family protein [Wenyingzhuangia sp.]|jgi:hypothetical protein|uniref:DinB family protein n=1 Tax=Wenyingzhuangia sp. TaxID=1964193 RepID=UPI00321B1414
MIEEIIKNLNKGKQMLILLPIENYCDKSLPPYYSSIGGHTRHVLDMFNCIFSGFPSGIVDLRKRVRDVDVELYPVVASEYFDRMIEQLLKLKASDLNTEIDLVDDLGSGSCMVKTTLGAVLAQAQSHTTHHYSTIGYLLCNLGVHIKDHTFGLNPTTPQTSQG